MLKMADHLDPQGENDMLSRQTVLRTALATGIVTLTLAGCGMMRPSQQMQIFEANLTAGQEVPPVESSASGMAEVQFNENTNKVTWKVTYSGLTGPATGAHIHGPAAAGANAGVLIPFAGNLNGVSEEGVPMPAPRRAGVLVAVRLESDQATQQASIILRAESGKDIEMADGVLSDRKWIDFDPVTPQRFISEPVDLP